ncbi:hypothetical protein ABTZ59_22695 [Streptomyces sp. NPDC094034]|uniref:hypothetical protein n=1 Tax=Streptomyces sp. NPDC094034 TaxID=3155309 RepID=UPI003325EED5
MHVSIKASRHLPRSPFRRSPHRGETWPTHWQTPRTTGSGALRSSDAQGGRLDIAKVTPRLITNTDAPEAERLDLTRQARQHNAFGFGPHQCLGQSLAATGRPA